MAIAITVSLTVLCCTLTVVLCRKYAKRTYSAIDAVLDNALVKSPHMTVPMEADSRLSKLTHKASKIIQMNTMDIYQTKQEKQMIQSFISDMSHQMKTPLSGISMYIDLLMEGGISHLEQQEFLSRIRTATDNLQWMMYSLVKMSRMEIGAIELAPALASIKQTLSESINMVLASAAKKNITIITKDFKDKNLFHDKKWTIEAMTNILENAVKYSKWNSDIHISMEILPIYTRISFTDYGIGIDRAEWNDIFKRFYRGRNVKDEGGVGLGLYLASLIMEKQGGYILLDSELGRYTTFSMFLQNCKNIS